MRSAMPGSSVTVVLTVDVLVGVVVVEFVPLVLDGSTTDEAATAAVIKVVGICILKDML